MQRMSAECVVACVDGVNADEVLDMMQRPKRRRNPDEKLFTVVLFGRTLVFNPRIRQK